MARRIEADDGDPLDGLADMPGREVTGRFSGRVVVKGRKAFVELTDLEVETENSADKALRELIGAPPPPKGAADENEEDDI